MCLGFQIEYLYKKYFFLIDFLSFMTQDVLLILYMNQFLFLFTCIVESGSSQAIWGLVVSPFRETPVPLRHEGKLWVLGFGKRHPQFLQRLPLVLKLHLVHFLGFVFNLLGESSNKEYRRENSPNRSTTNLRNRILLVDSVQTIDKMTKLVSGLYIQYHVKIDQQENRIPNLTLPKVLKKTNFHWLKTELTYK